MKQTLRAFARNAGPPLADMVFVSMRQQVRALQRGGIPMLHTARPFSYYRKVFYAGASAKKVLDNLEAKRIVDIGCGYTPYAEDSMFQACHANGVEFFGVDPVLSQAPSLGVREKAMARLFGGRGRFDANAPGLERALANSADELPFEDDSVDQILCSYLMFVWLEDEAQLAEIFSEFYRVLKAGGVIKLYPFHQWRFTRFTNAKLKAALNGFEITQSFVHGGLDLRVTPSMLTEFYKF